MKTFISILFITILLIACQNTNQEIKDSNEKTAIDIVDLYYKSLNNKNYETMYSLISEGFKQIEPTAKDYQTFELYMKRFSNSFESVEAKDIRLVESFAEAGKVSYNMFLKPKNVEMQQLNLTTELKIKNNEWKMIHPYSNKIDGS